MYLRALAVFERAYGSDHYEIAVTLNNLAGVRESQGRLEEAETQYRRALAIKQALFGPDHPDVAMTENNLALLLASSDRSVEAEPLYARALETFAPSSLLVIQRCRAVRPTTSPSCRSRGAMPRPEPWPSAMPSTSRRQTLEGDESDAVSSARCSSTSSSPR